MAERDAAYQELLEEYKDDMYLLRKEAERTGDEDLIERAERFVSRSRGTEEYSETTEPKPALATSKIDDIYGPS